jgi:hypothetical protein
VLELPVPPDPPDPPEPLPPEPPELEPDPDPPDPDPLPPKLATLVPLVHATSTIVRHTKMKQKAVFQGEFCLASMGGSIFPDVCRAKQKMSANLDANKDRAGSNDQKGDKARVQPSLLPV